MNMFNRHGKPTTSQKGDLLIFDVENGLFSISRDGAFMYFDKERGDNKRLIFALQRNENLAQSLASLVGDLLGLSTKLIRDDSKWKWYLLE